MKCPELFDGLSSQITLPEEKIGLVEIMNYDCISSAGVNLPQPKKITDVNWMHLVICMYSSRRVLALLMIQQSDRDEWLRLTNLAITKLGEQQQGKNQGLKSVVNRFRDELHSY